MIGYIGLLVGTFLLMSLFIMLGFPFKRWVESKDGILRKILTPILNTILVTGYIVDVFLNILLSPVFVEAPKRLGETVTMRVKRYKKEETGYKLKFAIWLCNLVNKFDPDHC